MQAAGNRQQTKLGSPGLSPGSLSSLSPGSSHSLSPIVHILIVYILRIYICPKNIYAESVSTFFS